jgi:tryptophan synthase beta chain
MTDVQMYGVEAGGHGVDTDQHCSLADRRHPRRAARQPHLPPAECGRPDHSMAHSISAGLDYPGIGPEHAWLFDKKRVNYVSVTDNEALEAFQLCAKLEGILPALEPSHAFAYVTKLAPTLPKDHIMVMNLCGRGDKDIFTIAEKLGVKIL